MKLRAILREGWLFCAALIELLGRIGPPSMEMMRERVEVQMRIEDAEFRRRADRLGYVRKD